MEPWIWVCFCRGCDLTFCYCCYGFWARCSILPDLDMATLERGTSLVTERRVAWRRTLIGIFCCFTSLFDFRLGKKKTEMKACRGVEERVWRSRCWWSWDGQFLLLLGAKIDRACLNIILLYQSWVVPTLIWSHWCHFPFTLTIL
jgi:hypothetical protein